MYNCSRNAPQSVLIYTNIRNRPKYDNSNPFMKIVNSSIRKCAMDYKYTAGNITLPKMSQFNGIDAMN